MQVTSLMSREEHDHHDHAHADADHEHIPVRLWQMVAGVIFVANSFLVEWIFERGSMVAGLSAMLGAMPGDIPLTLEAPSARHTGQSAAARMQAAAESLRKFYLANQQRRTAEPQVAA